MLKLLLITLIFSSSIPLFADSEPGCEKVLQAPLHFDPQTGKATLVNSPLATAAARALIGLGRLEKAGARLAQDKSDAPYFLRLADAMEIGLDAHPADVEHLPASGATLVSSNHPINGIDGIAIAALYSLKRRDVKIVLNEGLRGVPGMPENAIFIDMTDPRKSLAASRQMIRHWNNGGAIVMFPSAEVSEKIGDYFVDPKWSASMIAMLDLVKKQKVQIVSAFVEGQTDFAYRLARKVWDIPGVRPEVASYFTGLMNIRALAKRTGTTVQVSFRAPIEETRLERIRTLYPDSEIAHQKIADYLRLRSLLQKKLSASVKWQEKFDEPIADEIPAELIEAEVKNKMRLLSDNEPDKPDSGFEVYVARGRDIPHVVQELGRLREITFREVGEGSGKARDNDQFDTDYHHLIAWDKKTKKIVGAYRAGFLKEILEKYNNDLSGIYSHQFAAYSADFQKQLGKCIELGRSFVLKAYQRKQPLFLLLNGIARLYTESDYEYLIGMVSISNSFHDLSKMAMIRFLNQYLRHPERLVQTKNPPSMKSPITEEEWKFLFDVYQINDANSFKGLNELVQDIEGTKERNIPPLLKIYPDFGVRFVEFNVDTEFKTTDAFIAVHLPTQSPAVLQRIKKMSSR